MANLAAVHYTVDPSTNPGSWPPPAPEHGTAIIYRVNVIFINVHGDSNFRILQTGTNQHVHHAVMQVTKHIARGVYRIISMNVSDYSCVVVMTTEKSREELMFKNGFPWDRQSDPQPDVILNKETDVTDPAGRVPLCFSFMTTSSSCTEVLAELGADINKPNDFGETSLHSACSAGRVANIARLLSAGAKANTVKHRSMTPLMSVMVGSSVLGVQMLLQHGVEVETSNIDGESAATVVV